MTDLIRDPKAWLDDFIEAVPEAHRESMGQMQAIREYGGCLEVLPKSEQDRLWRRFEAALDERFPSRLKAVPKIEEKPRPEEGRRTDEDIMTVATLVFSAPGDQSPAFHEMLLNRAMGVVDRELAGEGRLKRGIRRWRLEKQLRAWMKENL